MRKTYKKIIALCAVLIFALALITVTAFADPFTAIAIGGLGGASGAGLFGSMAGASGLSIGFPSGTTVDECDALWNSLNPDHVYFSGEKGQVTETDPETGTQTVYDYITVDIGDWLQAQSDFIEEFISNYGVTDNSSGSISVSPSYAGYSFYNRYSTTILLGPVFGIFGPGVYNLGQLRLEITQSGSLYTVVFSKAGTTVSTNTLTSDYLGKNLVWEMPYYNQTRIKPSIYDNGTLYSLVSDYATTVVEPSYNASWVSGTINTGVFDGYSAAKVKIPASSWSPSDPDNWNVAEFLEELTVKLVAGNADQIIIEDDQGPTPPPVPIPSTPLGDIPTDEWYDLFGLPVLEGQDEIHQDLQDFNDSVSDSLDDIGDQLIDANDNLESIDTNIGIGNGLLGDLKSIGQSIVSKLDSILQGVQDLVQEIVLSTETFIAGLLNSIMGGLGGMFSTMREAFSIWHYVVEWVGSISTVFSWFWSVAGSTSYYIQLPIYASLAGAVVLAFYKRFGK